VAESNGPVVCERRGDALLVGFNRPDKRNAIDLATTEALHQVLTDHARERCILVLHSTTPGMFVAGADIGELLARDADDAFMGINVRLFERLEAHRWPTIAAVDGVCAGAGAILAMACDMRLGTPGAKVAFLFNRVGLAGCDMGACAILPRLVGAGRAAELLYTGRVLGGEEAERWGFFNRLATPDSVLAQAQQLAGELAAGPTFANAMTKRMLDMEWAMSIESAIEAEAVAQALCMETQDFARAFRAFAAKQKPVFEGN